MAKEVKKFKLKDLKITVPSSGQWEGLEDYPYPPLKESLQKEGYKPETYDYICSDNDGNVMYGSRRVWLMKNDMNMDQETEVDCEIMSKDELFAELNAKLNKDLEGVVAKKDEDGKMSTPKEMYTSHTTKSGLDALKKYHKKKANIEGYPYDYEASDGTKVDAGKS